MELINKTNPLTAACLKCKKSQTVKDIIAETRASYKLETQIGAYLKVVTERVPPFIFEFFNEILKNRFESAFDEPNVHFYICLNLIFCGSVP